MSEEDILAYIECPACGENIEFESLGEKICECGEIKAELTINCEQVEDMK